MKNRRTKWIFAAIIILVLSAVIINIDFFDRLLLLEKKNPGFYRHFALYSGEYGKIPLFIKDNPNNANLLVNTVKSEINENGFSITVNDDGSINYSGSNNGDVQIIRISQLPFQLPSGEYLIKDGGASEENGITLYLEGFNSDDGNLKKDILARLFESDHFVASTDYTDYWLIMIIPKGVMSHDVTFYPMIIPADQPSDTYMPCYAAYYEYSPSDLKEYIVFRLSKESLKSITASDYRILSNHVRYIYRDDYTHVAIDFGDGTGIVLDKNNPLGIYGELDQFKRVRRAIGEIAINNNCLILTDMEGNPQTVSREINGINGLQTMECNLNRVTDFMTYLRMLHESEKDLTIFFSVKGMSLNGLKDDTWHYLEDIGIAHETKEEGKELANYCVIDSGNMLVEQYDHSQTTASGVFGKGSLTYTITGADQDNGDQSSIILGETEYSRNERGLNIVVYDNTQKKVVDSVAFDTGALALTCRRW